MLSFLVFLASHFSWPLATQSFQPVLWSQGIPFLALSVIVVLENFLAQLFSHSEPPWLMLHRIVICVGIISFARVSSRSCSWLVTLLPSAISYLVTTIDHLVSRSRDLEIRLLLVSTHYIFFKSPICQVTSSKWLGRFSIHSPCLHTCYQWTPALFSQTQVLLHRQLLSRTPRCISTFSDSGSQISL